MAGLYRFLASYEVLIYIVLAIGALFSFRWLWNSWREWQQSVYKLEREFSLRRISRSAAISFLIIVLFCAEFTVASFVIPNLPASVFIPTPTLNVLLTPAGTLSPDMMTQVAAAPPQPASPASTQGCTPGQIMITSPKPGDQISGKITITGTADIPDFGFYKYEFAQRDSNTWATIAAGTDVKQDAELGAWDTTALTPGDYQLRVVVTDTQGKEMPPCIVPIQVVAP
ncbi:MAG TPA: hypothetical protein VMT73_06140 [Anaerolineales bacterium]|nr:hypothetical protein [Anaerolineales bacterium]